MWKSIDISKLDEFLKEYQEYRKMWKVKGGQLNSFSEWLEQKKQDEIDITDSIGVVTKGDFENNFKKEFIEENFDDLASLWFKGLEGQVDFGIVLESMEDDWIGNKYKKWLKKNGGKAK